MDAGPSGFKISMINMLKALMEKKETYAMTWVISAKRQILQEETKANTKNQNTVAETKNVPHGLISRQHN